MADSVRTIQVVDGDGVFQSEQLADFVNEIKLAEARKAYQVVAIMGPQSSGKSTLMNSVVSPLNSTSFLVCAPTFWLRSLVDC